MKMKEKKKTVHVLPDYRMTLSHHCGVAVKKAKVLLFLLGRPQAADSTKLA